MSERRARAGARLLAPALSFAPRSPRKVAAEQPASPRLPPPRAPAPPFFASSQLHQLAGRLGHGGHGHLRHDAVHPVRRRHRVLRHGREHGRLPARRGSPRQAPRAAQRAHHDPPAARRRARPGGRHRDPGQGDPVRERRRRRRRPRSSTSPLPRSLRRAREESSRAVALPRYVRETLNQIIADYTGQMQSKVEDDCDRDFFMTPEEAVECVASRSCPATFGAPSHRRVRTATESSTRSSARRPQRSSSRRCRGCRMSCRTRGSLQRAVFWCVGAIVHRRCVRATPGGGAEPVTKASTRRCGDDPHAQVLAARPNPAVTRFGGATLAPPPAKPLPTEASCCSGIA